MKTVAMFSLLVLAACSETQLDQRIEDAGYAGEDMDALQSPFGEFAPKPTQYVLDSGASVRFTLSHPPAPADAFVVFHTWSELGGVQAVYVDHDAPFEYPPAKLNQIAPGVAFVRAFIRNGQNQNLGMASARVTFVEAPPPPPPPSNPQTPSGPINLVNGANTIVDRHVSAPNGPGVLGNNNISVSQLVMSNVTIHSLDYGIYCGDCASAVLDHVDITAAGGGDSYSIRGVFNSFTSRDSIYRADVKAYRLYHVMSGSSTRDTILGGTMMLGGGTADGWVNPAPFENFVFRDGTINVDYIDMFDATHHVTFDHMNFAGTNHISLMPGVHHVTFTNNQNLPQIRFYNAGGQYTPSAAELAQRAIVLQ